MNDQAPIDHGNGGESTTGTGERAPGESLDEDGDEVEGEDGDDGETIEELSHDLVFDALKNSRRRRVLRYLDEHGGPVRLGDLTEHVAAIENDTTTGALDSAQRQRVYISLYQTHLPRLDDRGIIEFNQARGTVEVGPAAQQLEKYLDVDDGDDREWYGYHAVFTAISVLAVLGGMATGLVGTAGDALLVMLGTSVAFGVGAVALDSPP